MKIVIVLFIQFFFICCKKETINQSRTAFKAETIQSDENANALDSRKFNVGDDITGMLQAAINTGQVINLPKGKYFISKPLTKTSGTLVIRGENTVIQLAPSFAAGKNETTGAFLLSNLTKVDIMGLTIDGNRANLKIGITDWTNYITGIQIFNSSNITIRNCHIINAPSISFGFQNSSNILVDSCSSTNGMYHGILFNYCKNGNVSNSKIIGIGNQGNDTKRGGIGILGTGGDHLTFSNNLIENISDTGTKTEGTNNVSWIRNTVRNSGKDGIKFQNLMGVDQLYGNHSEVKTVNEAKIIGNVVDGIFNGRSDGSALIQVWNASNVELSDNVITGGLKNGQEDGICVWSNTDVKASNISIFHNTINNTNRFIYLSNVFSCIVKDNTCKNSVAPLSQYSGFTAEYSKDIRVVGNVFCRSATGEVDGFAARFFDCAEFTLKNNKLQNAYSALGLRLISSNTDSIVNNEMDNFASYGITIYSGTAKTSISSLMFTDNKISRMGMQLALGWMVKLNPENLTIKSVDFSNNKIIGNGKNGDWALTIQGAKNIGTLNLTNFYSDGNATYPNLSSLSGCKDIIGLKNASFSKGEN